MKKAWILIFVLVLTLGLCACKQTQVPVAQDFTFAPGTTVLNADISGLRKEDAWTKLSTAAIGYELQLTVDGVTVPVTAQEIDLVCSEEAFMAGAAALEAGSAADFSNVVSFNEGKLREILSRNFNKDVTEAAITFDEAAKQFVLVPHADGQKSNPNELVSQAKDAICKLLPQYTLSGVSEILHPVRSSDDPQVQEALALANKMIGVRLTYEFSPDGKTTSHEITAESIRSFVSVGEDGLTPVVDQDALDAYVNELGEKHGIAGTTGSFKTTGGGTVDLTVSYNGHYVDTESLAADIVQCMQEGTSGTRQAPYQASGVRDMAYGGTYVEVNLSAQHLWFYKNGKCIVSTDLVSGKVAENMCTPTGVFSLQYKKAGAYLEGDDYRTYVNYWMPFYYGYGLHDATWRGSFGGDIYLYSGSHGCVNLPLSAAANIYNNISAGTKVILYGGERSVPKVTQKLTGTTSYDVAVDTGAFKLNIKPKYKGGNITYTSDNTSVATVDAKGNVTVKGIGTANITVIAEEFSYYTEAETTVSIKVHSACEEGRHTFGPATTIKAPTCQPGLEEVVCTLCGHSTEREAAATESHSYGDWTTTKEPTCGAEGTRERSCTKCGIQKETEKIPATGNHTEGGWETVKEPTCTAEGTKKTKCSVCGTDMNTDTIPATGVHTAGDWQTVKEATCTEAGSKKKCCIHCGAEMETGTIEPGHKPGDWETVTSATCTQEGTKVKKCTACGAELESGSIGKKDHKFNGGPSCENCGTANPNYTEPTAAEET